MSNTCNRSHEIAKAYVSKKVSFSIDQLIIQWRGMNHKNIYIPYVWNKDRGVSAHTAANLTAYSIILQCNMITQAAVEQLGEY